MYVEQNSRLSTSKLWELQKAAYCQFGPNAWITKKVPLYLTSSPLIAKQYAQLAVGFIRDGLGFNAALPIHPQQPLYILDLGAGTGRFGYLFLRHLLPMLTSLKITVPIRYVMTDITLENLAYLQQHKHLHSFIDNGCLDFCLFHHDQIELKLHLIQSKETLSPRTLKNPLLLIANYFFDTIPHDLFRVRHHQLEEGRISLSYELSDETSDMNSDDPLILPFLNLEKEFTPLESFYSDYLLYPEWVNLLNHYASQYENIPQLLFPIGAFQVIKYFSQLSKDHFFLLAGDQGIHSSRQLQEELQFFAQHDSFSIQVNYHAIARYFQAKAAACLITSNEDPIMVNIAAASKGLPEQFPELCYMFQQTLNSFELSDYFRLMNSTIDLGDSARLEMILKLLKLGNGDPSDLHLFFPQIVAELSKADRRVQNELFHLIKQVWNHFYPVSSEGGSFVMDLGVLCYYMKHYEEALCYFQEALKMGYEDTIIFQNISAARRAIVL
jgi:SAM-dependent MidA family methyltransferase